MGFEPETIKLLLISFKNVLTQTGFEPETSLLYKTCLDTLYFDFCAKQKYYSICKVAFNITIIIRRIVSSKYSKTQCVLINTT